MYQSINGRLERLEKAKAQTTGDGQPKIIAGRRFKCSNQKCFTTETK